jgi:amino acid adenylation domain-containing protein
MNTVEFLSYLRGLGVRLWADGERLRYNAPAGALSADLRAELAERKETLLDFLRQAKEVAYFDLPPIAPVLRDSRPLPLSFAQQRLWFFDQLEPGNPAYNVPTVLSLVGPLDVLALEQALNELVNRHESLHTSFAEEKGQAVQIIRPVLDFRLPLIDLTTSSDPQLEARNLIYREARQPFDLSSGPLFRAALLKLAEGTPPEIRTAQHVTRNVEHILLITLHHIVSDGWSRAILIEELAALYKAFSAKLPSPLAKLPIQYADFAIWQRQWLRGNAFEVQLAYWKRQLGVVPPVLHLPTDRPRPQAQSFCGATYSFELPAKLVERLETLSRQTDTTLFMVLLAAFKALLYRYTGQEAVIVGIPIANRPLGELERVIGFFVNTLALRTDLSGKLSFRELLGRVRDVALGAYAHQDLPFEQLVEAMHLERDMSRQPLVQVMFALQDAPVSELEIDGLTLTPLEVDNGTSKFDLTLAMEQTPRGLKGTFEYNTDLFEAATIARMAGHFCTLLEDVSEEAGLDKRLGALVLLTPSERHQLLVEWNYTQADYPRSRCVSQLFEEHVTRSPEALAVAWEDQSLSYGELNRRANQLAHYLRGLGVGPEVRVGICMERSLDMMVALLGVLKAGGAYLPLDPAYPKERLAFMLEDAQVSVLVTHSTLLTGLPVPAAGDAGLLKASIPISLSTQRARNPFVLCLDTGWHVVAQGGESNLPCEATAENLAYVIYTSGSTGRPKGTEIEQQSLLNLVFWHQRAFEVTPADRATQVAGQAFDASVWEVWPYLAAGASLHIVPEDVRSSPIQLRDWLIAQQITISFLPTPLAESVLALDWPPGGALRTLLTGGDRLHAYPPPGLPFQVVNNYGPTENTVVTTSGLVPGGGERQALPSIGRPIANTRLYVLDRHMQPVPIGVPGELYIGGDSLARGYLNRPELTVDQFILDPFAPSHARLYKTGDLVRYLPDGSLDFLGRLDSQVKVRGFRIELEEIEALLAQHPAVQKSAVAAWEEPGGAKRLVAYVVYQASTPGPSSSEFRVYLKQKLPDYMLPAMFIVLEDLPLTPNGKVDRRALPAPGPLPRDRDFVAPHTPTQHTIAELWSQILEVDEVSIEDNFFELGGHSLLATQLVSRLREVFRVELPLRSLFESPTVADLAERIETIRWASQGLPSLSPGEREEITL